MRGSRAWFACVWSVFAWLSGCGGGANPTADDAAVPDVGMIDTGVRDLGSDGASADADGPDAGGSVDSGMADLGPDDASVPDLGVDAGPSIASLAFVGVPTSVVAGRGFPGLEVRLLDAAGALVTAGSADVRLVIEDALGFQAPVTLVTLPSVGGVVDFSAVSHGRAGTAFRFRAIGPGVAATSTEFAIVAAPAVRLAFITAPASGQVYGSLVPEARVAAVDFFGNVDPSSTGTVSVGIESGPSGGALLGGTSQALVAGVAAFSLGVDVAGSYVLRASGAGLPDATTGPIVVTWGASAVAFVVAPSSATEGRLAPSFSIQMVDGNGTPLPVDGAIARVSTNGASSFTSTSVTLTTTVDGAATFDALTYASPATGLALIVEIFVDGFLWGSVTSAPFDVVARPVVWEELTNGIEGGAVTALAAHPSEPATLYAAVTGTVYRSSDGGASWNRIGGMRATATSSFVASVMVAGVEVVVASTSSALESTADGGATWRRTTIPSITDGAVDRRSATPMLYWVSGGTRIVGMPVGGTTATTYAVAGLGTNTLTSIAVDETTTPTTIYVGTQAGEVFAWVVGDSMVTPLGNPFMTYAIADLLVDASVTPARLLVKVGGAVFERNPTTGAYVAIGTGADLYGQLAYDPVSGDYYSTGSPGTIRILRAGQPSFAPSVPFLGGDYTGGMVMTADGARLLVGGQASGAYCSDDRGVTFRRCRTGMHEAGVRDVRVFRTATGRRIVTALVQSSVLYSDDDGDSWTEAAVPTPRSPWSSFAVDQGTSPPTVYLADTGGSMLVSYDAGATFQVLTVDAAANPTALGLFADSRLLPNALFSVGPRRIDRIDPRDGTFVSAAGADGFFNFVTAPRPGDGTALFVGGGSAGVRVSRDSGATFIPIVGTGAPDPTSLVNDVAVAPGTPDTLLVCTTSGILVGSEAASFVAADLDGWNGNEMYDAEYAATAASRAYAVSVYGLVLRSDDGGTTFRRCDTTGLPPDVASSGYLTRVAVAEDDADFVVVGSRYSGLIRTRTGCR